MRFANKKAKKDINKKLNINIKYFGVIASIAVMLFSPTASGMVFDGYTYAKKTDEANTVTASDMQVGVYINSTGETIQMSLEEYVYCTMLGCVRADYEYEALKAVAVALRSSSYRRTELSVDYPDHYSADFCDDYNHCAPFVKPEEAEFMLGNERGKAYCEIIKQAVSDTQGEILYYEGETVDAVFHTSSYGVTEGAENAWGMYIPYLVSVPTPEMECICFYEYSYESFLGVFKDAGIVFDLDDNGSLEVSTEKNENGRVERVCVGGVWVTGSKMREYFALESLCFDVVCDDGFVVIKVVGEGHGVGMSICGANLIAKSGKEYDFILSHYYKDTVIGLC